MINIHNIHTPERLDGETRIEYQLRRAKSKLQAKQTARGPMIPLGLPASAYFQTHTASPEKKQRRQYIEAFGKRLAKKMLHGSKGLA